MDAFIPLLCARNLKSKLFLGVMDTWKMMYMFYVHPYSTTVWFNTSEHAWVAGNHAHPSVVIIVVGKNNAAEEG